MPFNIGPGELIIVLIIALIVVGPGKLPDVGSALGKSIREFRKAATDVKETTSLEAPAAPPHTGPAAPAAPCRTRLPWRPRRLPWRRQLLAPVAAVPPRPSVPGTGLPSSRRPTSSRPRLPERPTPREPASDGRCRRRP